MWYILTKIWIVRSIFQVTWPHTISCKRRLAIYEIEFEYCVRDALGPGSLLRGMGILWHLSNWNCLLLNKHECESKSFGFIVLQAFCNKHCVRRLLFVCTYPVWCKRSQRTNKMSTSKGVICDIIWAECRNSSEKRFIVMVQKSKNRTMILQINEVPFVISMVLDPLVAFK